MCYFLSFEIAQTNYLHKELKQTGAATWWCFAETGYNLFAQRRAICYLPRHYFFCINYCFQNCSLLQHIQKKQILSQRTQGEFQTLQVSRDLFRPCQTSKMILAVIYFRKTLHVRGLIGFWMHIWCLKNSWLSLRH